MVAARSLVMLLLAAQGARAGEHGGAAPPATSAFDFNLFEDKPALSREEAARREDRQRAFDRQVKLRRSLLKWHQGFGFATLLGLAATLVIGQLDYLDRFDRSETFTERYHAAHLGLGIGTSALFAATAMLALVAPNPYPKPIRFDPALVHKVSMALAAACFVTQIILGPIANSKAGTLDERPLALAHLVVGYAAFGFMGAGTLAYVVR
jgi:hypothetical protein